MVGVDQRQGNYDDYFSIIVLSCVPCSMQFLHVSCLLSSRVAHYSARLRTFEAALYKFAHYITYYLL